MLHPTEAQEKSKCAFEAIMRKGSVRFEIDFIKKNGEVLSTEVSSSLLEINDRKVVQGIVTDVTERKETEEKLRQQATADPLTGIFNRRHFFELAEKELARSRRYSRPLSVLIFDIDHFKKVNDTYGHAVGDQALCTLVAECQAGLRENDVFARYGGEEFIILLPESDLEQAGQMAERIRMRLAGTAPLEVGAASVPLTASFGVSSLDDESLSLDELILRADSALYDAKEAGRNRVSVWCQTASGNTK
jgi:diguanylate cyclase (GGDEF)-like protein